jgi:hypothetical protein
MKTVLGLAALISLLLTIVPSILVAMGLLSWQTHATLMTIGMITWFVTATLYPQSSKT